MQVGMLWQNEARGGDLPSQIRRAAGYYRRKYGQQPNECYVHPSMLADAGPLEVDGIVVRPLESVLPQHLWLGVGEARVREKVLSAPAVFSPAQRSDE